MFSWLVHMYYTVSVSFNIALSRGMITLFMRLYSPIVTGHTHARYKRLYLFVVPYFKFEQNLPPIADDVHQQFHETEVPVYRFYNHVMLNMSGLHILGKCDLGFTRLYQIRVGCYCSVNCPADIPLRVWLIYSSKYFKLLQHSTIYAPKR